MAQTKERTIMSRIVTLFMALSLILPLVSGCARTDQSDQPVSQSVPGEKPVVLLKTSLGDIRIELDRAKAPISVASFESYVNDGFYDGTIFHRVIEGFMIQGGGFTTDMKKKTTKAPIKNEADNGLKNLRGTIAMARTQAVHSATSQFFINVVDNSNLDYQGPGSFGYAVFGRVIEGLDVVDAIRSVPTTTVGPHGDVPKEPVVIEKAVMVG